MCQEYSHNDQTKGKWPETRVNHGWELAEWERATILRWGLQCTHKNAPFYCHNTTETNKQPLPETEHHYHRTAAGKFHSRPTSMTTSAKSNQTRLEANDLQVEKVPYQMLFANPHDASEWMTT